MALPFSLLCPDKKSLTQTYKNTLKGQRDKVTSEWSNWKTKAKTFRFEVNMVKNHPLYKGQMHYYIQLSWNANDTWEQGCCYALDWFMSEFQRMFAQLTDSK